MRSLIARCVRCTALEFGKSRGSRAVAAWVSVTHSFLMIAVRPAALALGLFAGRAASLVAPAFAPHKLGYGRSSVAAAPAASGAAPAAGADYELRSNTVIDATMLLRYGSRHAPQQRGRDAVHVLRLLGPCSGGARAASSDAGQPLPVGRLNGAAGPMSATHEPPVGGYPPPEHLHGVFAVYKPKGFSSADVVQKIKVLCRQLNAAAEFGGEPEGGGAGRAPCERDTCFSEARLYTTHRVLYIVYKYRRIILERVKEAPSSATSRFKFTL